MPALQLYSPIRWRCSFANPGAGIPIATASMRATPSGIPIPFPAVMAPLQARFPAIDPVHFRDILENCFRPGNIVKRSATSRLQETAASIPTGEKDQESSDYKPFAGLTQPWNIYTQALLRFYPLEICSSLRRLPQPASQFQLLKHVQISGRDNTPSPRCSCRSTPWSATYVSYTLALSFNRIRPV